MSDNQLTRGQKAPYNKPNVQKVPLEPAEALNACCKLPSSSACKGGNQTGNS
jgi:hypothetical protein